jgi:hypothetical protein
MSRSDPDAGDTGTVRWGVNAQTGVLTDVLLVVEQLKPARNRLPGGWSTRVGRLSSITTCSHWVAAACIALATSSDASKPERAK